MESEFKPVHGMVYHPDEVHRAAQVLAAAGWTREEIDAVLIARRKMELRRLPEVLEPGLGREGCEFARIHTQGWSGVILVVRTEKPVAEVEDLVDQMEKTGVLPIGTFFVCLEPGSSFELWELDGGHQTPAPALGACL